MSVININKDNYDEVVERGGAVLLDFYADWCGPCRMVAPLVEEIANEHPEIAVGKVNVDREGALAGKFKVYSIPTLVALKGGKVVNIAVGARPKEAILALFENS